MADLSITPSDVIVSGGIKKASGIAGESILAGQPVYKDTTDANRLKLTDADLSAEAADCVGLALHGADTGQPLQYVAETGAGTVSLGAILTPGVTYYVSATAGGIAPEGDLAIGWYACYLGVAEDTDLIKLRINAGTSART